MEIDPSVDAAQLVRALRRAAGASQRDLAAAAGISKSLVAAIESGSRPAQWRIVLAIAEAAGAAVTVCLRNGTELSLAEPAPGARDRGARHFPAHADVREADGLSCNTCDQFRDALYGRRKTHTYRHPKPHSRWPRWRDWRGHRGPAPAPDG